MSPATLAAEVARLALVHGPAFVDAVGRLMAIFMRSPGQAIEVQRARGLELDAMFAEVDARLAAQRAPTEPPPAPEASLDSDGKDVDDLADEVRRG